MGTRAPLAALALAVSVAACGCGADQPGATEGRASDTVSTFAKACARGDFTGAADLLAESARSRFVAAPDKIGACAEQLGLDPAAAPAHRTGLEGVRTGSVTINGDQAVVTTSLAGTTGRAELEDQGLDFRISTR